MSIRAKFIWQAFLTDIHFPKIKLISDENIVGPESCCVFSAWSLQYCVANYFLVTSYLDSPVLVSKALGLHGFPKLFRSQRIEETVEFSSIYTGICAIYTNINHGQAHAVLEIHILSMHRPVWSPLPDGGGAKATPVWFSGNNSYFISSEKGRQRSSWVNSYRGQIEVMFENFCHKKLLRIKHRRRQHIYNIETWKDGHW